MLKAIRQFDKKTREGILSDIILEIGRPSLDGNYSVDYISSEVAVDDQNPVSLLDILQQAWRDRDDVRLRAVEEIYQRLNLKRSDLLRNSKDRVLEFVGREIRTIALESNRINEVRQRLGQKGILAPNAYQIKYANDFTKNCEHLGITKTEINKTVEYPDMFEHFVPEVQNSSDAISLYVKGFSNGSDPYSLLVDSMRSGDKITVHFAFRAYHSDIDVSNVTKPTDLLKAFTDKFGMEISVGDEKAKLILYKRIEGSSFDLTTPIVRGNRTVSRLSQRKMANNQSEVSIAYGVDLDSYAKSLREHETKTKAGNISTKK